MPLVLAKDESQSDRLRTVLYNLLESIRVIGVLITPFLPETGINKENKNNKKSESKQAKNKSEQQQISIEDFAKMDLRTGKIVNAKKHPNAEKLLILEVMVGEEKRQIVSGIAKYFKPEELKDQNVVVVTNLKPAKLRGELSEGMILMAEDKDGKLTFISPKENIESGLKVR